MVYYIRAKSYYKYAESLYKDLIQFSEKGEKFKKKAKEIFQIVLKSLWALSKITPVSETPEFDEIWKEAIKSLNPEEIKIITKAKEIIFSFESSEEEIIEALRNTFEVVRKTLSPIL
jgi:hypothetical protein